MFVGEGTNSFEITADFDSEFGVVAATGSSVVPGNNCALEDGFGGAVQVGDVEKFATGAVVEVECVRENVWGPWSLFGLLERWCFGQGMDLKIHCLYMTGAADWMTEGNRLEMKGGKGS